MCYFLYLPLNPKTLKVIRITFNFIQTLCEKFESASQKLCSAVGRLKEKGDELKIHGDQNWYGFSEKY